MAQSQCRRSVEDKFWPGVVVEKKPEPLAFIGGILIQKSKFTVFFLWSLYWQ